MTSIIAWKNIESSQNPSIWVVGDTKISDSEFTLSNQGSKIMEVILKVKDLSSVYQEVYFQRTFGLAFAGSSLIAYNIYNVLNHFLSNVGGLKNKNHLPRLEDIAIKGEKILGFYADTIRSNCELFLIGTCPVKNEHQLFKIFLEKDDDEIFKSKSVRVDLKNAGFDLLGDKKEEVTEEILKIASELYDQRNERHTRAPIYALNNIIKEKRFASIGGNLQFGILHPVPHSNFELMSIWGKDENDKPKFYHNNIDLVEMLGEDIGNCRLGIKAMNINY